METLTKLLEKTPPKAPMTGDPYLDRYNYGQQQIIRDALERLAQSAKEC